MSMSALRPVRSCALLLCVILVSVACQPKYGAMPTPAPLTLRFALRRNAVELQELFDEYHARHPHITIEPVEFDRFGSDIDSLLSVADIDIFRGEGSALRFAREDLLRPLDDIQLGDWAAIRDDYYEGTWRALSLDGQQWGIPAGYDVMVMYINMDQARALNVAVPGEGWTAFDLLQLATKLNYPKGLPHEGASELYGFCSSPESMDPIIFVYLHGGRIVDDLTAPTRPTLNDPRTIEAIQWYTDLYTRYQVVPAPDMVRKAFPRGGLLEAQIRGHCGVWSGWYSARGGPDSRFQWSVDWQMMTLPAEGAPLGLGEVEGYYITTQCENPKEALRLLRFLSDRWEASGQRLPPRRSLVHDDAYIAAVGKDNVAIAERLSENLQIVPNENSEGLERVGGELLSAVRRIITDNLDAATVLEESQDKVRTAFQHF